MRRPRARSVDPASPAAKVPVALALALAALAVLGLGRWWLARPPPLAAPVTVDAGSYVTAIAPSLRRAGCAASACHGGSVAPLFAPAPGTAAVVLAELDAVRLFVGRGDPAGSPLWSRATSPAHAGRGALTPAGCEARALARWIAGAVVRTCPLPSATP